MKDYKTFVGYWLPEDKKERSERIASIIRALVNVMSVPVGRPHSMMILSRETRKAIGDILELLKKGKFPATLQSGTVPTACHGIIDLVYRADINCEDEVKNYLDLHNLMYFALTEWREWSKEEGGQQ